MYFDYIERTEQRLGLTGQRPNAVEQHTRCPTVVLIIVENPLPDGRVAGLDPAVKPFDRCGAGRVRVAPCESEMFRQRLD